jgi:hypothetical protein
VPGYGRGKTTRAGGDRSGQAGYTVQIDKAELAAIRQAIRDSGAEVRRSVRQRLKVAGEIVAEEIRRRTPVGRHSWPGHKAGTLARKTFTRPGTTSVRIVNTALNRSKAFPRGYRYGKRIEFDPTYSGRFAFFYPGIEAKRDEAVAEIVRVLDDVARQWNQA